MHRDTIRSSAPRGRLALLLLLLALVAAACAAPGWEDEDDGAPVGEQAEEAEPEPTEEAEAPTPEDTGDAEEPEGGADGEVIRIGVLAPTTGGVAASGEDMLNGWNLFWDQNGTEVAGRTVESIHRDTAGDPSVALTVTEELVDNVGVDMVVGPLLANVGLAVGDELSRAGVPTFMPIVSADDLTQRDRLEGVIRIAGWTSSQTTHPFGEWAYEQGYQSVVTLCADYAFGHETCGGFVNTFTDAGGEVVEQLWNPLNTQDFGTYLAQIQAAGADAVFVTQVGGDSVRFVDSWDAFGLAEEIPLLGNETLVDQSLLRNMGPEAEGIISVGHFAEGRESPETQEFVEQYLDAYDQLPSYYAVGMFTAARWLATAIEELDGDISDTDAFLDTVRGIEFEDTPMGPMALDEYDNPIFNVYVREVQTRDDGLLHNVVVEEFDGVSQFWNYDPEEFLEQPVYSREFQGAE